MTLSANPYADSSILRQLARRILEISHNQHLSHIGSCLTALPIIYSVYQTKGPRDKVVLSAGHSYLALLTVLEYMHIVPDAQARLVKDGIHPVRGVGVDVSTGSLGQGMTVAVGMTLARPDVSVHVISTDGELASGAIWESLYFAWRRGLNNLKVYINDNGYSALDKTHFVREVTVEFGCSVIDTRQFVPTFPWFAGLAQHYQVMTDDQYAQLAAHYA